MKAKRFARLPLLNPLNTLAKFMLTSYTKLFVGYRVTALQIKMKGIVKNDKILADEQKEHLGVLPNLGIQGAELSKIIGNSLSVFAVTVWITLQQSDKLTLSNFSGGGGVN